MSVVAGISCAVLGVINPPAFWSGYLVAATFWMSISAGCLAIGLIHGTSGGRWGQAIGRSLHAGISTLPYALIACWVLALGASMVFPWAATGARWESLNPHQKIWLDPIAVGIRFAVTCVLWVIMGLWLNARYKREGHDPNAEVPQGRAALGIIVFFVSFSIVAIDFMMALSPAWASSMYPLIRILNCGVSALAVCAIAHNSRMVNPTVQQLDRVHDIGNLLQAFNLLWTYLSFSQYILIWTGDIAGEVVWYMDRRTPFWMPISFVLFGLHFVLPFLLLLSRGVKRAPRRQSQIAGLLLVMCFLDVAWTLLPSIPVATAPAVISAVLGVLAIGGIWLVLFQRAFDRLPDVQIADDHDPAAHRAVELAAGEST
ncbi:hypothetical protein SH661x_003498 [Planctomicrobium sp. SH661]|uniref:hypothetical protein n=1 Tax=Planctomicrobium sp. SH661 TaxID=3448124 RepID=UPI003F5C05AA